MSTSKARSTFLSNFEFPPAVLHVKILRGTDLYKTDLNAIDPYVEVALGSDSSRSVTHLEAGSNCSFDWSVSFPFDPARVERLTDGLVITVWDQDLYLGGRDDEVGRCALPIKSILGCEKRERAFMEEVKLVHIGRLTKRKKYGGSLEVEIYWERHSAFSAPTESLANMLEGGRVPLPLNYCVTNFNDLAGVARSLIDKGKMREYSPFRTYRLRLWHVALVFEGYTKGWNIEYQAAQKIYGRSPSSMLIRAALRVQNYVSYSNDYINNVCEVHEVRGTDGLRRVLDRFDDSPGRRYTYVIMPDSHMHFSLTSKDKATDFLSKHALHAGAAEEVVYSGEFFFDRRSRRAAETGKTALVIDNNSGTFAPPKEKLGRLKLLMQLNFGTEIPILALDRGDPMLKELSEENGVE